MPQAWEAAVRRARGAFGPLAAAVGLALGAGVAGAAHAAAPPAASLLGAYAGQTVAFASNPAAGTAPTACVVDASGPTLLLSNDPERVPGAGILYRDTVQGSFRVFLEHANASPAPLHIGLLVQNASHQPVSLYVTHQAAAGPSSDFLAVGKLAEHLWFEPFAGYEHTIQVAGSYFPDPALIRHAVPPGQSVSAVFDALATGPVTLSVVAEPSPATSLFGLHVLAPSTLNPDGTPMRGTFPAATLSCAATIALPEASGTAVLPFGADAGFLRGVSAVDGHAHVVDYGNYGVLYDVALSVTRAVASPWSTFAVVLHAHDHLFAGMAQVAAPQAPDGIIPVPLDRPYIDGLTLGVMLAHIRVDPYSPTAVDVRWMAAASSWLPVDLMVVPVA